MCKLEIIWGNGPRRMGSKTGREAAAIYCNLFDSHTHSSNSFDGNHTVMFMCETAQQNGLLGLSVTDHFDTDLFGEQHNFERLRGSYFDVCKARAAFGGLFSISAGLELGEPDADFELAEQALKQAKYDFVLGSAHTVPPAIDFYYCDFSKEDAIPLLDAYFERLQRIIQWGKCDVLAHLTYPARYMVRDGYRDVLLTSHKEQINECLRMAAQSGMGLEINTNGLRGDGCGFLMPTLEQLISYREYGGELITIGSDAHRAEDIGANIADGMELAEAAGFRYLAFFKNREPRMLKLI